MSVLVSEHQLVSFEKYIQRGYKKEMGMLALERDIGAICGMEGGIGETYLLLEEINLVLGARGIAVRPLESSSPSDSHRLRWT
jgi:hypothetical protein